MENAFVTDIETHMILRITVNRDISWGKKIDIVVLQPEEKEREVTKMPNRLETINWWWGQMKGNQEESDRKIMTWNDA